MARTTLEKRRMMMLEISDVFQDNNKDFLNDIIDACSGHACALHPVGNKRPIHLGQVLPFCACRVSISRPSHVSDVSWGKMLIGCERFRHDEFQASLERCPKSILDDLRIVVMFVQDSPTVHAL